MELEDYLSHVERLKRNYKTVGFIITTGILSLLGGYQQVRLNEIKNESRKLIIENKVLEETNKTLEGYIKELKSRRENNIPIIKESPLINV